MACDLLGVERGPDQPLQRRIAGRFLDDGESLVGQVPDTRREPVAQEWHSAKTWSVNPPVSV